jgi:4-amino-4-deoxy-L-arabinose transferase-like glycosyltransferase
MTKQKLTMWFWVIVLAHIFLWTVLPTLIRYTLPMDANEGYLWGTVLDFGYDRDPWLNGWLTRFAIDIGGRSGWVVYAFGQLCSVAAFWGVWRLGQRIFCAQHAFLAVFLLEGIQYYHLAVIDFNDNALELGLWPLMIWIFYRALVDQKIRYWVACGLLSGLGLMAKYYTLFPLCCMFLFMLYDPKARAGFKQPGFYLGLLAMILVVLPHIFWLFDHDFITIRYTQDRVALNHQTWWMLFKPALRFLSLQGAAFLGGVLLWLPLLCVKGMEKVVSRTDKVSDFDRQFLLFQGLGPLLLTLLVSLVTGWQLNTMWGTPLLSLWGLVLLLFWQPKLTQKRLSVFIGTVFVVLFSYGLGYTFSLMKPGARSSANEPAEEFVTLIERLWFDQTEKPLYYVAGDRYLAGYVVYYSSEHPEVLVDYSTANSHPIDLNRFREKGAVFVQRIKAARHMRFPPALLAEYPGLIVLPVQHLPYHRSVNGQPTLDVLIGILPPSKQIAIAQNEK